MAVIKVLIVKSKGFIEVDTDKDVPDAVYQEALALGLKVLLNRGTSKITKTTYPKAEELVAAAQVKAEEQLELVRAGKIKFSGGAKAAKGASGAVMTEARRLAKNIIKDSMKEKGIKISHVAAKDITAAANAYLADAPELIAEAEANLAARAAKPAKVDISSLIKVDPALVAKAEAKKAEKKPLSAKQAGKTAPRAKGGKGKSAQATA